MRNEDGRTGVRQGGPPPFLPIGSAGAAELILRESHFLASLSASSHRGKQGVADRGITTAGANPKIAADY
ncbi:unnamed protein product [Protopolystoma xenopodis]|uniref:Uncharacterized protein n=1 Tax=Protopolystoma xenopodis TaxID=117903 RepID=A0A3S5B2M2_9PLAT|nr:unnamed protein product [Protopolystoma xenopodis]